MDIWLDDERDPKDPHIQASFSSIGDKVWVKNADEAIAYLKTGRATSISLDHDLGQRVETGMKVAEFIEKAAKEGTLPNLKIWIHTMNPAGRKNMQAAIRNAKISWGVLIKHDQK